MVGLFCYYKIILLILAFVDGFVFRKIRSIRLSRLFFIVVVVCGISWSRLNRYFFSYIQSIN